jgi:hypothetical protein
LETKGGTSDDENHDLASVPLWLVINAKIAIIKASHEHFLLDAFLNSIIMNLESKLGPHTFLCGIVLVGLVPITDARKQIGSKI